MLKCNLFLFFFLISIVNELLIMATIVLRLYLPPWKAVDLLYSTVYPVKDREGLLQPKTDHNRGIVSSFSCVSYCILKQGVFFLSKVAQALQKNNILT